MSPNLKVAVIGQLSTITVLPQTVSSRATEVCIVHTMIKNHNCQLFSSNYLCISFIFTHRFKFVTPSWFTYSNSEWQLYLSHTRPSSGPRLWLNMPHSMSVLRWQWQLPLSWFQSAVVVWWHAPCMGPHTKSGVFGVTTLCCVLLPCLWCALQESSGSNTRWLLILGCSICYAGAPPSLVFHVERRRTRHVS